MQKYDKELALSSAILSSEGSSFSAFWAKAPLTFGFFLYLRLKPEVIEVLDFS